VFEMKATLFLLAGATSIALCACGGYRSGASPNPSRPQASSPEPGYAVLVTEQDRTADLQVGQKLLLELHAKPGMTNWSGLRTSDASVLIPLTIDVMVPRGVTIAAFQAVAPGQADVTAFASPSCSPGQMCPAYAVLYTLRVTVKAGPPTS
jgi:hypothetical protein